jgi:DNA invertase Pin-like site-specific DNA recombinase
MNPLKRCAIYTRKSSEEGLEQEFNSLQAQREACEAFIKSQRHEGWVVIDDVYDDGGISGGTMERPALKRLLQDIRDNKINIVVVYKVDRLTRSLADFAKIVELFDSRQVSFVSVTQQFNTTSSMGRLTLNVLLSFAQFEREVTGERIRDKVAASKKKGMWMGGMVPLGYDAIDKKLMINQNETKTVQYIFQRYLELGCVRKLQEEIARKGIRSKDRGNDCKFGKSILSRGTLYNLLSNPIYIGQVRHKGTCHPGQHDGIIEQAVWDRVQQQLMGNAAKPERPNRSTESSLLLGKLFDETGTPLTPSHAVKEGRRYRYYVSHHFTSGNAKGNKDGWRLPAQEIENTVLQAVRTILEDAPTITSTLQEIGIEPFYIPQALDNAAVMAKKLSQPQYQAELLLSLLNKANLRTDGIETTVSLTSLLPEAAGTAKSAVISRHIPMQMKRRGIEMRLIIENGPSRVDQALIKALARAHAWHAEWMAGESITAIANRESCPKTYVRSVMKLVFLAPDITEAIIAGYQPADMMADKLIKRSDIELAWPNQRKAILEI